MHRQGTLIAAGFDFVAQAKIGRETPIVSTLPPVRFASLVAGPVAALLLGAALHLDGPFEAQAFLKSCERAGRAHLIAPALFGADFAQAGVTKNLASLTLVSQMRLAGPLTLPDALAAECALIDLYAFDEIAAVPEQRLGGMARQPAQDAHHIGFENTKILAVKGQRAASGGIDLLGAAVSDAA
jgi:hypothetical protein